jgi:hypothetical protein
MFRIKFLALVKYFYQNYINIFDYSIHLSFFKLLTNKIADIYLA